MRAIRFHCKSVTAPGVQFRPVGLNSSPRFWLTGAVGLCLGFGHWVIGFGAVMAGISILFVIGKVEDRLGMAGSVPVDEGEIPKGDATKKG